MTVSRTPAPPSLVLSLSLALSLLLGLPAAAGAQGAPAGGGIGTVVERTLPAQVKRAAATAWEDVQDGAEVRLGDAYKTGPGGRLKMIFDDKSILILSEKSSFEITRRTYDPSTRKRESLFKLYEGKIRAIVGELFGAASKFEIESPTALAGVKGTDFEERIENRCTTVFSHAGDVYARNANPAVKGEVTVGSGMFSVICENKPPTQPGEATEAIREGIIPLRGNGTLHPTVLPEPPPGGGGPPKGPDYPSDIVEQPTDTTRIPEPGPPSEPPPPPPSSDRGGQ
jgi:ferric-dicitrate binding protein FerR (iron transport regulator)